ncbi:hypothetical protein, partial [Lachnoclostridium sp. An14]|uniref:hypothetical protein n=1 Tax=Lachnoclostridium sp. An14 TaxID=1965562 RepID=UPI001FA842DF
FRLNATTPYSTANMPMALNKTVRRRKSSLNLAMRRNFYRIAFQCSPRWKAIRIKFQYAAVWWTLRAIIKFPGTS